MSARHSQPTSIVLNEPSCYDAVVAPERIGQSTILYMTFALAPPADARLTVTLERIYVSTGRTWRGTIRLR